MSVPAAPIASAASQDVPDAPTAAALADESSHHAPAHEPPPLGPAATPTNSVQPDVDATTGRDHYDERDEQAVARPFPGTWVVRDAVQPGLATEGPCKGRMIEPRPYAGLLYDESGAPRLSPQALTYLAGPEPRPKRVRQLVKALEAFRERDERGYAMVAARFDEQRPATERTYAHIAQEFGVSKTTAHNVVVAFIEEATDWADAAWATELERSAEDAGSLDDDDGGDGAFVRFAVYGGEEPDRTALTPDADPEPPVVRRTPIESYCRMMRERDARRRQSVGA